MKNQIVTLIIGILIGAIISTGVFLVLKDDNKSKMPNMSEMNEKFNRNDSSNGNRQRPDFNNSDQKDQKEETKDSESNKN